MSIPNRSLPLMIDVEGHPYLIEAGEVDLLPSGVPAPENIYPQLPPSWEAPSPVVPVEHGETLCILGRRFQVNMIGDLELVALALPGESEYEAPAAPVEPDTEPTAREAALNACRVLVAAYELGSASGSVDWSDLDAAHAAALGALARAAAE